MITEDFCSYEVSKLLKEKGFDTPCRAGFTEDGKFYLTNNGHWQLTSGDGCLASTHQMAMKYLREVHKLFITIDWTGYENEFSWTVQDMNSSMSWESDETYILCELAVEAALKYCLTEIL